MQCGEQPCDRGVGHWISVGLHYRSDDTGHGGQSVGDELRLSLIHIYGLFMKDTVKLSCTRKGGAISVLTICFDPAANEYGARCRRLELHCP